MLSCRAALWRLVPGKLYFHGLRATLSAKPATWIVLSLSAF